MVLVSALRDFDLGLCADGKFHAFVLPEQNLVVAVAVSFNQLSSDEIEAQERVNFTVYYIVFRLARYFQSRLSTAYCRQQDKTISSSQWDALRFGPLSPTPYGWSLNLPLAGLGC